MGDERDQVRARLCEPAEVCRLMGVQGKRVGKGQLIRCLWHQPDRNPSCSVTKGPDGTLRYKCFSCGATGDVFGLAAAAWDMDVKSDFTLLLDRLCDMSGVERRSSRQNIGSRRALKQVKEPTTDEYVPTVEGLHLAYLHGTQPITEGEVADYLRSRGLWAKACEHGWRELDAESLEYTVGERLSMGGNVDDYVTLGLIEAGTHKVRHAHHKLCIPWPDPQGNLVTMQRRTIDDSKSRAKYIFPPDLPPTWPYGVDRYLGQGAVVITEGAMDALAVEVLLPEQGTLPDPVGIALPGASTPWQPQWDYLLRGRCVFATDSDEAGQRLLAALKARRALMGHAVVAISFSPYKDAAEYLKEGKVR